MTDDKKNLDIDLSDLELKMKSLVEELKTFSPFIDSVQIFCTAYDREKDDSRSFEKGVGNMFTRIGVTQDFCNQDLFEDV